MLPFCSILSGCVEELVKGELIPKPQSTFIRVKCAKCGNEQVIFDRPSVAPRCSVCQEQLADPTGGKAKIRSEVLQVLG
ncbi:MAG TPA: 30S ribosomal protein S27e [Candidatus Dormibacteraeota bacterium]|nr:30S ribosomal protein S27e [Candidatus Dormibacteraeota bacterium]